MCDAEKEKPKPKKGGASALNIAIRIVAMGLAVAAAALMATATECTVVLPFTSRTHTITYRDFTPYVYLVVANTISAILVGIAIFLSVWKKGESKFSLSLIDAALPALLYSATGAAFATVGYMSFCAAPGRRVSVCAAAGTGTFCGQVHLAMYLSLGAAVAVTVAEVVKSASLALPGCGGSDKPKPAAADDCGCGHGCSHH